MFLFDLHFHTIHKTPQTTTNVINNRSNNKQQVNEPPFAAVLTANDHMTKRTVPCDPSALLSLVDDISIGRKPDPVLPERDRSVRLTFALLSTSSGDEEDLSRGQTDHTHLQETHT